ncbi:MAG: hypothetical protein ACNYZG_03315 [Gammaproteobacteria bacterium]
MVNHIPECMGNYDFDKIAYYAKKRFIEDCSTIELMAAAKTQREKEEIALVSLLHVSNDKIQDLQLTCKHANECKVIDCRERLINKIAEEIGTYPV